MQISLSDMARALTVDGGGIGEVLGSKVGILDGLVLGDTVGGRKCLVLATGSLKVR